MTKRAEEQDGGWLLLIHQVPPKPDYLRVKVGRRLQRVGAVAIKNSVYALPDTAQALEDFQWIRTEIIDAGGDASVCRADFIDGLTSDEIRDVFRAARAVEYVELAEAARALNAEARRARTEKRARVHRTEDALARLRKRLATIESIDFFASPDRAKAKSALDAVEARLTPAVAAPAVFRRIATAKRAEFVGRTWVTREHVFVDRIASAWLIRRFVDPGARFKFVHEKAYVAARGELRFDMYDGEFTHEGDRCTFEVLVRRFGIDDPAIRSLGEVIHDIDLKDGKFDRQDAPGIERVVAGIVASHADDGTRLDRGAQLFDELYALFKAASAGTRRPRHGRVHG